MTRPTGYFPWCKSCHAEAQKRYARVRVPAGDGKTCPTCLRPMDKPHANRIFCSLRCKERAKRWKVFGLTPQEFQSLTASGTCPLCGDRVKRWVIDHNHATGETLGPVCQKCNQYLLVGVRHNPAIARRLIEFLEHPPVERALGERRFAGPESASQIHRMWLWGSAEQRERPQRARKPRAA